MKQMFKFAAIVSGCAMAASVGAWRLHIWDWITAAIVAMAGVCALFVSLYELATIHAQEKRNAELAKHSAWRAEFIEEMKKL